MIYVLEVYYKNGAYCKKKFRLSHELSEEFSHYRQNNIDDSYNAVAKLVVTFEKE